MNVLILILIGVLFPLSEQSFVWIDSSNKDEKNVTASGSRFIVNIVEFTYKNNTYEKNPSKFRCIGTLVSKNLVITTANCVNVPIGTHIGVQFETIKNNTNEVGYSLTFDNTTVIIHNNYKSTDNEMNNIALIKFNSLQISTEPPLFTIFSPQNLGSIPRIADTCTIVGRNVHLLNPSRDSVFIIGPDSCYGQGGRQAFCSIFESKDSEVCKVAQGAPVICKPGEISGFVLRESKSCIESNGKFQLRYHSIDNFKSWLNYWMVGPSTTTPKPNSGRLTQLSFVVLVIMLLISIVVTS